MKKTLLVIMVLLAITAIWAMPKGTKNIGGAISLRIADESNLLKITPQIGYFVVDNLSVDLDILYQDNLDDRTQIGVGLGARGFIKNFYGGAGLSHRYDRDESWGVHWGVYTRRSNFADLKLGMVYPISKNVYFDFGANYSIGIGSYGGNWSSGSNDELILDIVAGIQVFF